MPEQHKFPRQPNPTALLQHLASTLFIVTIYAAQQQLHRAQAGASSTPKNLVNNPHVISETLNLTRANSNQFQNEYQYRQTASKSTTSPSERHKLSTPTLTDAPFEHASTDTGNPSTSDYSFDSRAMTNVPDCRGRLKLNGTRGFITDGPGYYQTNLQCIWMIDSGSDNATIRIQLHQFNTECNYDFLYIFDGDSVYSPLVAALSGDMRDFSNAFAETRSEDLISSSELYSEFNHSTVTPSGINMTLPTIVDSEVVHTNPSESQTFELRTHSGKAFIYFHSDTAQSMPGFYMTYSIDSCPLDCSNRGECDYKTSACKCNSGFYGDGCQYVSCPNNCTSPAHGTCDKDKSCICFKEYTGRDCSKKSYSQAWKRLTDNEEINPPRAFHQSVIVKDILWIFGGKSQALSNTNMGIFRHRKTQTILAFDLESMRWIDQKFLGVTGQDHLAELSGHSAVIHGNKVFIYGGMSMNNSILNTLSVFDTDTRQFSNIPNEKTTKGSEEEFMAPLSVTGHSANMIDGQMYVFMGYNALYGYLDFVQMFNIANNSWSIIERRGSSISGLIGHTSTFDPASRLVYIYGGHNALRSNNLYTFDPYTTVWTYLLSGPSPRYYHSALIMNGQLMILGGNSYNTSHQSDQCFQQSHLVYDLSCARYKMPGNDSAFAIIACGRRCWSSIEDTTSGILKRHGQSILLRNDKELILYGGFNGVLMNDLRSMKVFSCSDFTNDIDCNHPKFALNCEWNIISSYCEAKLVNDNLSHTNCSKSDIRALQSACESRETCSDCMNTNFGCVWCGLISQCEYNKCKSANSRAIQNVTQCIRDELLVDASVARNSSIQVKDIAPTSVTESDSESDCKLDNCYLCQSRQQCSWHDGCSPIPTDTISSVLSSPPPFHKELTNDSQMSMLRSTISKKSSMMLPDAFKPFSRFNHARTPFTNSLPEHACDVPCFMRRSCNECTTTKCIWCSTTEQCIDSSAYFAYHAIGQCMHYVAHMLKCPVASCSDIETCDKCLANPKCGWLNDISNTGKGRCIEGNSNGPSFGHALATSFESNGTVSGVSLNVLPNWFYTSCPSCQCNGHSYCRTNSTLCAQPCQENTEGPHCDRCIPGYYGDPVNGGSCRPCRCNGHAQSCNRETGKCYCSTKGITGHNCNRCDDKNYYIGDPSSPGNGTCYYNLTTDYQYTFNMSKPEDHFYSDINFINVPLRKDSDVDFSIACSRLALVNITSGTSYRTRRPLYTGLECGSFRLRFPFDRHALSEGNFSFFVHVYRFQTPFILQIAFSQHRTLYLPQFFFTLSR